MFSATGAFINSPLSKEEATRCQLVFGMGSRLTHLMAECVVDTPPPMPVWPPADEPGKELAACEAGAGGQQLPVQRACYLLCNLGKQIWKNGQLDAKRKTTLA